MIKLLVVSLLFLSACSSQENSFNTSLLKSFFQSTDPLNCTSKTDCLSGQICDFLFPGTDKIHGTCRTACLTPGSLTGVCASGEICSPITGACEPSCTKTNLPNGPGTNTALNVIPTCSSQTTTGWVILTACGSANDCAPQMSCDTTTKTCGPLCTDSSTCPAPSYEACTNTICTWDTCDNTKPCLNSNQSCSSPTSAPGYCVPAPCTGSLCNNNYVCTGGTCTPCSSTNPCPSTGTNTVCNTDGTCQAPCKSDSACSGGQVCYADGKCGSCDKTSHLCPSGQTCLLPSGVCSCTANQLCTNGQICQTDGTHSICQNCTQDSDCAREGAPTQQVICSTQGTCIKKCASEADCTGGQVCYTNTGKCGPCDETSHFCGPNETCGPVGGSYVCQASCNGPCTGSYSSLACINHFCQANWQGDAIINGGTEEVCDEGSLTRACTVNADCPSGFVCPHGVPNPVCVPPAIAGLSCGTDADCEYGSKCMMSTNAWLPNYCTWSVNNPTSVTSLPKPCCNNEDCGTGATCLNITAGCTPANKNGTCNNPPTTHALRGNGLNGHCSTDGTVVCAYAVGNPTSPSKAWHKLLTVGSLATAVSNSASANPTTQCPNGYGVWVSGNPPDTAFPITVSKSINIYGGFNGSESAPSDRKDSTGSPFSQNNFSSTIFNINASLKLTAGSIIIDGFQFSNSPTSAITIALGTSAYLDNLRFKGIKALSIDGGAISNAGTTYLKESMFLNNTALNGGAISNTGTLTVQRSTFYANGTTLTAVSCTGTPTTCSSHTDATSCATETGCSWTSKEGNGGAITSTAGSLSVYASTFNNNYAYGTGGAIQTSNGIDLESSLLVNNWASNAGGAVAIDTTGTNTIYYSTFIDNAAYRTGGGGIWIKKGSNSTTDIQTTLFRDNTGLYPVVSPGKYAEWIGNRLFTGTTAPYWQSQINSIADQVYDSAGVGGYLGNATLAHVDLCPIMSYTYSTPNCDGSPLCGNVQLPYGDSDASTDVGYNRLMAVIIGRTPRTCHRNLEFVDCYAPTYSNCNGPSNGKAVTAAGTINIPNKYLKDLIGKPIPASNMFEGAFQ